MEKEKGLIGYYNYTVVLTYIGAVTGFLGIVFVVRNQFFISMILMMVAGLCDMFDGAVASTKKDRTGQEKSFGVQIDSLSDLICFGVLPAVFLCGLSRGSLIYCIIAAVYVLCALIRLAFFNVDELDRISKTTSRREYILGLPVTMSSCIIPLFYSAARLLGINTAFSTGSIMVVISILFVVPVKMRKSTALGKVLFFILGIAEFVLLILSK